MDAQSWILLAGVVAPIVVGLLGWLVYIERRMLTREDHARICKDARDDASEKLDRILEEMKAARESRHTLTNTMHELALKVAVLTDRSENSR
jgi:hypothetical protein